MSEGWVIGFMTEQSRSHFFKKEKERIVRSRWALHHCWFLYSSGVIPVIRLNIVQKVDSLP